MRNLTILLCILFALSSCAHAISKQTRQQAVDVPLFEVRENIDKYKGSTLILGGFIVKATKEEESSVLEIVQNPIDRYGVIIDRDVSEGRFLAVYKGYLDPLIYKKNREVTLAGRIIGTRVKALGDAEYNYPIVEVVEIFLWKDIENYNYATPSPYYNFYIHDYYNYPPYQRAYSPWLATPLYPPHY